MPDVIVTGSTDVTRQVVMRDATTRAPKADVTVTDIDLYYQEQGAAQSAKADVTALAAADSAHADNKAFNLGNGEYRVDWPDAAFDGGAGKIVDLIYVCSGCETVYERIHLVSAHRGLTGDAVPDAAADAAAGLPVSDAGGLDLDTYIKRLEASFTAAIAARLDENISAAKTLTAAYDAAKTAAQAGDPMTLADDAITSAKFDESTAFPLESADTGATAVARTGADSDTLETLSDQIDEIGGGVADWTVDERKEFRGALGITGDKAPPSGGDLQAAIAAIGAITPQQVVFNSPVSSDGGTVTIYQGDDYLEARGNALPWTVSLSKADLTGATVSLWVEGIELSSKVYGAGSDPQTVKVEATHTEMAALPAQHLRFQLKAVWSNDDVMTLYEGTFLVNKNMASA